MFALLDLYFYTIIAGAIAAPALALLGCHLATRDRAMQTLCIGQGAMLGVLMGILTFPDHDESTLGMVGPFVTALLASAATFFASDRLVGRRTASKNTIFAFIFALLLAAGYLISSLFPGLENHLAQIYFGDLATLTENDSKVTAVVSLLGFLVLLKLSNSLSNQSFEQAIFGDALLKRGGPPFNVLALLMLCLSVQFVGFLFTVAMLFLPTALMSRLGTKGLRLHYVACASIASVSTVVGFLLSLQYSHLPTVPTVVIVMSILSLSLLSVDWVARAIRGYARLGWALPTVLGRTPVGNR